MSEFVLLAKDLVSVLWNLFLAIILLWFITHLVMAIIKTLFCDVELKLYRVWKKKLKQHMTSEELEKHLEKVKNKLSEKV